MASVQIYMDAYTLEAAWEPGYLWCPDEVVQHIKPMAFGLGNVPKKPTKTTFIAPCLGNVHPLEFEIWGVSSASTLTGDTQSCLE